jgi:hypothetical protein
MSLFNPVTSRIAALLDREKRRQTQESNEIAVEAMQIGLAFTDEEEEAGESEGDWAESPQFDAALKAFAQMEELP